MSLCAKIENTIWVVNKEWKGHGAYKRKEAKLKREKKNI